MTATTTATGLPRTGKEIRQAALDLEPEIAERAQEGEQIGKISDDLLDRISNAGLIDLMMPSSLGGLDTDVQTVIDVVEILSRADGSAGFTILTLNATFFTAWLEEEAARKVLADRPRAVATVFAPRGRAEPHPDGGVVVSGRWPFNTGCRNASWTCNGVMLGDGSGGPGGEWRMVFAPMSDVTIHPTWAVAGLRGTGSNDVQMTRAHIPQEFVADLIFTKARHDSPTFRFTFFALMGVLFAGLPIGIANRALHEFEAMAPRKSRGSKPLAQEQTVQLAVARARADVNAARAYVADVMGTAWDRAAAGDDITVDDQVAIRLATGHAMRAGIDAVNTVFGLAGGGALYDHHPLQRCWRDINAASHHGYFSQYHEVRVGMALLDQPVPDLWMI